jgi:hypothetical protein
MGGKQAGKTIITDALYGLALALGSYLILNTINPDLLKFDLQLDKITKITGVNGGTGADVSSKLSGLQDGVAPSALSKGRAVSWSGGAQNGRDGFGNQATIACPGQITTFKGFRMCSVLAEKLTQAEKAAGVSLIITQTFKGTPSAVSKSGCHSPGSTAGSCADVSFSGHPGLHQPGWGKLCKALGSVSGLSTLNEASNLKECTDGIGPWRETGATGPHLHVNLVGN